MIIKRTVEMEILQVIDLSSWTEASLSGKTSMAATWHQAFSTHGLVGALKIWLWQLGSYLVKIRQVQDVFGMTSCLTVGLVGGSRPWPSLPTCGCSVEPLLSPGWWGEEEIFSSMVNSHLLTDDVEHLVWKGTGAQATTPRELKQLQGLRLNWVMVQDSQVGGWAWRAWSCGVSGKWVPGSVWWTISQVGGRSIS